MDTFVLGRGLRILAPLVIILIIVSACEMPGGEDISVEADYRYESQIGGASLVGDFTISNQSNTDYNLYAFVFAAEEGAPPTTRGAFPPAALREVGMRDTFRVTDPSLGHQITLPAQEEVEFSANVRVPGTAQDALGRPGRFDYMRLYLVDEEGEERYRREWSLTGEAAE